MEQYYGGNMPILKIRDTYYVQTTFNVDGIDIQLRSQAEGLTKIQIYGSTDNSLTESGDHYQLHRPDFYFDYLGDMSSETAEQEIIQQFYQLPNVGEIMDYYRKSFEHLIT